MSSLSSLGGTTASVEQEQVTQVEEHFFEGAEKLLEIWFESTDPAHSLRRIPRAELDEICRLAKCEIISEMHNAKMSAYVLSESSLFVSDQRLIIKTCGTTAPLHALTYIIHVAAKYCGQDYINNVFYSRKNFIKPDKQPDLHTDISDESLFLDGFVDNGQAYCLGSLKSDRWYLYTCNPPKVSLAQNDSTMEVLMQELDADVMDIFNQDTCRDGAQATKLAGIEKLMPPGTIIDDHLFEPCGYSMNALIADTDEYATIHVTPEPDFSYVSFETNQTQSCMFAQLCKVLRTFRPQRFLMNICADHGHDEGRQAQQAVWDEKIPGYKRIDLQMIMTSDYAVIYARYVLESGYRWNDVGTMKTITSSNSHHNEEEEYPNAGGSDDEMPSNSDTTDSEYF